MITLKQFIKLIPYYQDFKVGYYNSIKSEYVCIIDSSFVYTEHYELAKKYDDWNDFMKKYGECYVESVEAVTHKILYINLYERR